MEFKKIEDKELARLIFIQGQLTEDENRNNYSVDQFNLGWNDWTSFFVLYDNLKVVAFCGVRQFDGGYARIFDRYFVHREYRSKVLKHNEYSLIMLRAQIDNCNIYNNIPFFSIQDLHKRKALKMAVLKFNKVLNTEEKFHVLDGLYNTVPNGTSWPAKVTSWQNIAIQQPHQINLEQKHDG